MPDDRVRRPGASDSDEQWGEHTQLDAPRGPEFKLVATAGPITGQTFVLSGTEAVIGRSAENALSVNDNSVSRKHARLRLRDGQWAVSDLKSGNGTRVNGLSVGGEIVLRAGDVITVGDTALRYVAPPPTVTGETQLTAAAAEVSLQTTDGGQGPAPSRSEPAFSARAEPLRQPSVPATTLPEPIPAVAFDEEVPRTVNLQPPPRAPSPPSTGTSGPKATMTIPVLPGGSGSKRRMSEMPSRTKAKRDAAQKKRRNTMLLWGGVALGVCLLPIGVRAILAANAHRHEQEALEARARIDADFQNGKDAMRSGQFELARAAFTRVQAADPSYGALDFLGRIDGEVENQKKLRAAQDALDHGQLAKASDLIAKVRPDTSQRDALVQLRSHLVDRARERLQQAQKALDGGDVEETLAITTDVLKALPDEREALRLRDAALTKRGAAE